MGSQGQLASHQHQGRFQGNWLGVAPKSPPPRELGPGGAGWATQPRDGQESGVTKNLLAKAPAHGVPTRSRAASHATHMWSDLPKGTRGSGGRQALPSESKAGVNEHPGGGKAAFGRPESGCGRPVHTCLHSIHTPIHMVSTPPALVHICLHSTHTCPHLSTPVHTTSTPVHTHPRHLYQEEALFKGTGAARLLPQPGVRDQATASLTAGDLAGDAFSLAHLWVCSWSSRAELGSGQQAVPTRTALWKRVPRGGGRRAEGRGPGPLGLRYQI